MKPTNKYNRENNQTKTEVSLVNTVKELADITRREIERSYNINDTNNTEAYYSNRYGWILRRTIS